VVARYGGDEFVVLMPETGVEQAQILSERLRLWIASDTTMNDRQITASFGVSTFPMHGATAEDILHVADMGMYHSKRTGGNRVATPEDFTQTEGVLPLRQVVNAQLESFLHRAEMQPEAIEELLATLNRLQGSAGEEAASDLILQGVRALQKAAEVRETLAAGHGETVAEYAEIIGQEMNLPPEELLDLVQAARLHDVGKILMPEQILNKDAPLSEQELRTIRMHPVLGARIVGTIPGSSRLVSFVRHHHERVDGTGYPDRMKGEAIPLGARIIGVAEAYANMCAEHCYAAKRTPAEALAELERLSGTQFDGMVVRLLGNYMRRVRAMSASSF
jgi:HD-GYP domain-containing protein (c-di-GMP phosphodiesterase class II)